MAHSCVHHELLLIYFSACFLHRAPECARSPACIQKRFCVRTRGERPTSYIDSIYEANIQRDAFVWAGVRMPLKEGEGEKRLSHYMAMLKRHYAFLRRAYLISNSGRTSSLIRCPLIFSLHSRELVARMNSFKSIHLKTYYYANWFLSCWWDRTVGGQKSFEIMRTRHSAMP